jgi:tetratricopeptide (TPR) repeat protein
MRAVVLGFVAALLGGAAMAAAEPQYGPPPAWVKEADLPAPKRESGVMEFLLNDAELKARPEGLEAYSRMAFKILSPEALNGAGNLTFSWRPDTSELTINHLRIVRDGKVIDLLAGGEKLTVIRREQNLEQAIIDGELTAVFQPAGLQVGDILDMAYTMKIHDPALRGHIEDFTENMTAAGPDQLRVRMLWPTSSRIRWRATEGLAQPKITKGRDETELLIDMQDVQPVKVPDRAPPRFNEVGYIEVTDFASWKDASALLEPVYREASVLRPDSPLKAEVAKIRALSNDPKIQATAALRLVQDKVRYVALVLNDGGYVPAKADDTWTRRFGDCKAKSVLLVALLKELGIEAEPALASVTRNDGLESRLPLLNAFDHVIVRAVIGGKVYWLDGTRIGDRNLDEQPASAYHWALPVRASGAVLEALPARSVSAPLAVTKLDFDASGGLDVPAPVKGEILMRGDSAKYMKLAFDRLAPSDLDDALRKFWKDEYDWIDIKSVHLSSDEVAGELRLTMEGMAKMEWSGPIGGFRRYETDGSGIGWKTGMKRDGGPHQDAPFAVTYPYFTENIETIVLPNKGEGFSLTGKDVDITVGAWKFHRKAAIADGVLRLEASTQATVAEIPAADALASAAPLQALNEDDVYIIASDRYRPTDEDMAVLAKSTLTTAADYIQRGSARVHRGEQDAGIADFNEALKLDPKSATAYADRGLAEYWKSDFAGAAADADKALSIDPRQYVAYNVQGLLAERNKDIPKAIEAYGHSYDYWPYTNVALLRRAELYQQQHDLEHANADVDTALKNDDHDELALALRASILQDQGKPAEALAEADRALAIAPDDPDGHLYRANALLVLGRRPEARPEFEAALKMRPSAAAYIGRAQTAYQVSERKKAIADVDEALKLEPEMFEALLLRANMLILDHQPERAMQDIDKLVALKPDDPEVLTQEIAALTALHRSDEAVRLLDRLPIDLTDATDLNDRCWVRATMNKELDNALADCDAALKLKPTSAEALDSRGLVHLRRGELDASIRDYDAALKLRPAQAASLFGRGVAKLEKGLTAAGQADLAAARRQSSEVEATFAGYGVTPPNGAAVVPAP